MTWRDAIDHLGAAGHLHVRRFRELCEDDADRERRDGYREVVIRLASGQPLAAHPVDYGTVQPPQPCCGQSLPEAS